MGEIYPFLCAIAAHRAVKQLADAGERLLLKCNEVICGCGFLLRGQLELAIQRFQIISNRIHRNIIPQFGPVVKRVFGNFHRICLIGLDLAERVVAVLLDEQRVDSRNIEPGFVKDLGDTFIVASCVFHDHPRFAFDGFELLCQCRQIPGVVAHIKGQLHDFAERTKHGHSAFSTGNINTCCVHVHHS